MKKVREIIFFVSLLILSSSCKSKNESEIKTETQIAQAENIVKISEIIEKDVLVGEFSLEENGKAVLKITKQNGIYYKSEKKKNGSWNNPQALNDKLTDKICKNFGFENCNAIKKYAIGKHGGIFYIDKNAPNKVKKFKSNYWIIPWFDGYKVK